MSAKKKTAKLKITQVKSAIGYRAKAKNTLVALGIKKMNHSVIQEDNAVIRGMIDTVAHLVTVDEIKD